MHAPETVLSLIENGYEIMGDTIDGQPPITGEVCIPKLGADNGELHEATLELAEVGICHQCSRDELINISPVFLVEEGGGKAPRHIFNASKINERIKKEKFKLETAEYVRGIARKGMWAVHFDISKAFHHLKLGEKTKKYFGFATRDKSGKIVYWMYDSIPQGYMRTPVIFKNVTKPLITYIRAKGILLTMYCDDGMTRSPSLLYRL